MKQLLINPCLLVLAAIATVIPLPGSAEEPQSESMG